ncbi:MAG: ankyrin repeat domain-containing protein, partial [Victivallaceae bacterium]
YNTRRYSNATSALYPFSFIDVPMFARAFSGDNQAQFQRAIELGQSRNYPEMHKIMREIVYNPKARQDDRLTAMELFARTQNTLRRQEYAFFPCNRGNLLTASINNAYSKSIYTAADSSLAKEFIDMATELGVLNERSSYSRQTFLHHIVQQGYNIEVLEYCLKRGANTEISDYHNTRALYKACTLKNLPAVKLLLKYGADPNALNDVGYTALAMTACYGKEESLPIVDALLAAGADINLKPANGSSPALICAADNHNMLMVKYLISKGADKNIVDSHKINIMDYGIIHKYQPLIDFCESINLAPTRPAAD